MKALSTALSVLLFNVLAVSQVHTDKRIELVGNDPTERQVLGLPDDQAGNAALSAGVEQAGSHRFAIATIQSEWEIALPSLTLAPEMGTHLLVKVPEGATGIVQLRVNEWGPYPVVLAPNAPLTATQIPAGTVLSLVFDGLQFQIMNGTVHAKRPCPAGMSQASEHYCIDGAERGPETFFMAALRCAEDGLRLCTWSEFYQGCIQSGSLGLSNMVGNHEWVDDAMNEDLFARVVGRLSCTTAGGLNGNDWQEHFRCCYTR